MVAHYLVRMRTTALLALFSFLVACAASPANLARRPLPAAPLPAAAPTRDAPSHPDLDYTVRRVERGIVVELAFEGAVEGRSPLSLPSAWAGEKELYKDLQGLEATSPGARIETTSDPARPVVVHPPGAMVTIRYELPMRPELEAIDEHLSYRVLVQKHYLHAIGHALWVTPASVETRACSIHIRWTGFEQGAAVANSFGTQESEQTFTETVDHLRHAVFVVGDFRVHEATIRGKKVAIALRGKWGFQDGDLVNLVSRVVDVERAFFKDDDFDRYLVTLIPTGRGCCSYGGTGLTDSFATFVSSDLPIERRMIHLLSHELFHTWNGRRIGRQSPEELVYWFSEGFTDYYAELLSFRAGLTSLPEYVEAIDSTLRQYHLSTAKNARNEDIRSGFWSSRAVERLPYQRGLLLALLWNDRIRARGRGASLDDMMRDLFGEARDHGTVVSAEAVDRLIRPYLSEGVLPDIGKYVDRGETVPAVPGALGPCVKLTEVPIGPFDLGFDEKATDAAGVVSGVVKGGAAERAGLRNGMKIRRSRWSSDPTKKATLTVIDKKRERTIEYFPQGTPVKVPQYRIDEKAYARDPARCEAPIKGQ